MVPCPDSIPEAVRERIGAAGGGKWGVKPWPWYYRWQEFFKRPMVVGLTTALLFVVITAILGDRQKPSREFAQEEFTQEEIELAELEARLALAYLGKVTDRTGEALRHEVLGQRVVEPIMRAVKRRHTNEKTIQPQGVHNAG